MSAAVVDWLRSAPLRQTVPAALLENFLLHGIALAIGAAMVRRFEHRRLAAPPPPLSGREVSVAVGTLLMNTLTTLAGLFLWRAGILRVAVGSPVRAFADAALLLFVMDAAMFTLHRIAHFPWIYPWLHAAHHEHVRPRPLTLFVLNPIENLAFGSLMLGVLIAYPFHWLAIGVFLAVNLATGIVGHLGVEPLPDRWIRTPVLRFVNGGTFHVRHHQDVGCHFGFYTAIWDRLAGTLRADEVERFGKM